MSICGLFFCGTHMQRPFSFFLDIFTPKTFLLHAVYVEFHGETFGGNLWGGVVVHGGTYDQIMSKEGGAL